jgi:hypothetical protein
MRGGVSYVTAGVVVVLSMDLIMPPAGLGLVVGARLAVDRSSALQSVDRKHKGDRMPALTIVSKQQLPPKSPAVLIGCEPVFSPLSASKHANFPGRCVA